MKESAWAGLYSKEFRLNRKEGILRFDRGKARSRRHEFLVFSVSELVKLNSEKSRPLNS